MDINENHGQVNVNCEVVNKGDVRLPLRPDAVLRDCPNCFGKNAIDSPICTNCNTSFARYRNRLIHAELERMIQQKEREYLAWLGFSLTVFLLGAIPLALWQTPKGIAPFFIGVVMCLVSPYGKQLEQLKLARDELAADIWI